MTPDTALRKLQQALRRLEGDQGRIARRNARQATLAALRELRRAVDETYPAIKATPRPRKRRQKTPRWTQEGWIRNQSRQLVNACSAIGVKTRTPNDGVDTYFPVWVHAVFQRWEEHGRTLVGVLHRAKKDLQFRRAIESEWRLVSSKSMSDPT